MKTRVFFLQDYGQNYQAAYRRLAIPAINYKEVFRCGNTPEDITINDLFDFMNQQYLEDPKAKRLLSLTCMGSVFQKRAMSVGDVIQMEENGKGTAYRCDAVGWSVIPPIEETTGVEYSTNYSSIREEADADVCSVCGGEATWIGDGSGPKCDKHG